MQLSAIEIENFQSFESRQRIQFGRLTLFFGPNSAGKSAIADAYTLITTYLFDRSEARTNHLDTMIKRWARHRQTAGFRPKKIRDLSISIEFQLGYVNAEDLDLHDNPLQDAIGEYLSGKTVRINVTFEDVNFSSFWHAKNLVNFEILVANRPLLAIKRTPTSDGYIKRVYLLQDPESPLSEQQLASEFFQQRLNALRYESDDQQNRCWIEEVFSASNSLVRPEQLGRVDFGNSNELIHHWDAWFDFLLYDQKELFKASPPIIEGDRGLMEDDLLSVDLNLNWEDNWPEKHYKQKTLTEYWTRVLGSCAYADLMKKAHEKRGWSNLLSYGGVNHTGRGLVYLLSHRLKQINGYLEDSLFIDKFYSVSCDATMKVDLNLSKNPLHKKNRIGNEARVTLKLLDENSNQLSIKDVGSGIPYCLPWLTAITASGTIWIQQPELHLHPALQTRVGDVLIDASSRSETTIVVETHSEHIILRLLRRIRDTAKNPETPFSLEHDELEVYYFDPEVASGTTITRLPVTEEGEFYMPWPKGFFRERDEDLFGAE